MYLPYTALKVLHDQQVQEALERQRPDDKPETRGPGLLQTFGKALARFNTPSGRKQEKPLPDCAQ